MFKLALNTTTRGLAVACMTTVGIPTAWSEDASRPQFRNGRACWDTLCDRLPGKMQPPVVDQRPTPAPKASNQATATEPPATSPWTTKTVPLPPTQASGKTSARADAFYKYPMIYRAEAPPSMPPGTSQPYVQATPGVWYWPGADSIKIPVVAGFDPVIDPSRVVHW
jgi:hypothetical protein